MRPGAYERQRAALGVVHAAWKQHGPLPVALVQALEDALMLMSPESAAELARLQALMNAQPADLTPEQIEALETVGNRVVNDHHHEDQCMCETWPEKCLSASAYIDGTWDMGSLPLALPAIVGLWEVLRAADDAGEVGRLRARVAELESERHTTNEALADVTEALRTPEKQMSPEAAFAAADAHIRGDGCAQCKPSNRLPEMCPEGQRLSRLAMSSLVPDVAATEGAPC